MDAEITEKDLKLPYGLGEDFTVVKRGPFDPVLETLYRGLPQKGSVTIKYFERPARVQPARCFNGRAISLTVRSNGAAFDQWGPFWGGKMPPSRYAPDGRESPYYLRPARDICLVVEQELGLLSDTITNGFVIVAGSTGALKTELATGLIHLLLERKMEKWYRNAKGRKPHLVTCEDDIEKYFVDLEFLYPLTEDWIWDVRWPDCTPRSSARDFGVGDDNEKKPGARMWQAVADALRMKPTVFYGGEIRDLEDWKPLYTLAQSHLVVVTTHSASLAGTFRLLEDVLEIHQSSQRSDLAAAIAGIIHMRTGRLDLDGRVGYVLPALWKQTLATAAAYTANGLASIIPGRGDASLTCFGRQHFAELLLKRVPDPPFRGADELKAHAAHFDLTGV